MEERSSSRRIVAPCALAWRVSGVTGDLAAGVCQLPDDSRIALRVVANREERGAGVDQVEPFGFMATTRSKDTSSRRRM